MRLDDEVIGKSEGFGGHVVDIHDSSFHCVVREPEGVHKRYSDNVVVQVLTDPKFLEGYFPIAGNWPFVYRIESQLVVSGSIDSPRTGLDASFGEVREESVEGIRGEAVDLCPGVEEYFQSDPIYGDGNAGAGVGLFESLRESIDSSVGK
jgi:hypothetical protein